MAVEKKLKVKANGINISHLKEGESGSFWGVIFTRVEDEIYAELPKDEADVMIATKRVSAA